MIDEKTKQRIMRTKQLYDAKNEEEDQKKWGATEYMSGYVKDVGDLSKLIMVKSGLRGFDGDIDHALKHEIGDCFWSLFMICDELGISPEEAIETVLHDLEGRFGV